MRDTPSVKVNENTVSDKRKDSPCVCRFQRRQLPTWHV